jgi:probable rRNA maturation factor
MSNVRSLHTRRVRPERRLASPQAVRVYQRQRSVAIRTALIKRRLQQIMAYLGCADRELSVVLAGDRLVRRLNRTYRGQDRPTNVLAFPQYPTYDGEPSTTLLGDVVVSLPTAAREAQTLQQCLEEHVVYLLLHGLLHLLGYDHEQSPAGRRRMERREQEVLAHLREQDAPPPGG